MTIHVEPEHLATVAHEMIHHSRRMEEAIDKLRRRQIALESAWQGGDAEDFHDQARRTVQRLLKAAEELRALALRLHRTAEGWYLLDLRGRERYHIRLPDK